MLSSFQVPWKKAILYCRHDGWPIVPLCLVPARIEALRLDRWQISVNKRWTRAGCRYLGRSYVGEKYPYILLCRWPTFELPQRAFVIRMAITLPCTSLYLG